MMINEKSLGGYLLELPDLQLLKAAYKKE